MHYSPQAAFSLCLFLLATGCSALSSVVLWEANFHSAYYNLVPLGEYIYLGRNIKLRTAIQTAGILLPVFLFYQIVLVAGERNVSFSSFLLPTLAFQWQPCLWTAPCSIQSHCIVQQVLDPALSLQQILGGKHQTYHYHCLRKAPTLKITSVTSVH